MLYKLLLITWLAALGYDIALSYVLGRYKLRLYKKAPLPMFRGILVLCIGNLIEDLGVLILLFLPSPNSGKIYPGLVIWLVFRIVKALCLTPAGIATSEGGMGGDKGK